MGSGHKWFDIKKYPLGTIGVFLRSVDSLEASKVNADLAHGWLAFHATQKSIVKFIDNATARYRPEPEDDPQKIERDWDRLAMFVGTKLKH